MLDSASPVSNQGAGFLSNAWTKQRAQVKSVSRENSREGPSPRRTSKRAPDPSPRARSNQTLSTTPQKEEEDRRPEESLERNPWKKATLNKESLRASNYMRYHNRHTQQPLKETLFSMLETRDLPNFVALLRGVANLGSFKNKKKQTLLHLAAQMGLKEIIGELRRSTIDRQARDVRDG